MDVLVKVISKWKIKITKKELIKWWVIRVKIYNIYAYVFCSKLIKKARAGAG